MGKVTLRQDEACSSHFFNASSTDFSTFISSAVESRSCPDPGRYEVLEGTKVLPGLGPLPNKMGGIDLSSGECTENSITALSIGCSSPDVLELHTSCSNSEYSCHGWWEEKGRQFLVVTPTSRSSKGVRRLCLVMNRKATGAILLASSADSCSRELFSEVHGRIALNTTAIKGGCGAVMASGSISGSKLLSVDPLLSLLMMLNVLAVGLRLSNLR